MVDWVLAGGACPRADPLVVVTSPDTQRTHSTASSVAVQAEPRGTGDAVASARDALDGFDGDVLVALR